MFAELIESAPSSRRWAAQSLLSLGFHVAVGAAAVAAGHRMAAEAPTRPQPADIGIYLPPEAPRRMTAPASAAAAPGPAAPDLPTELSSFAVPADVPVGIPPVTATPSGDPGRFVTAPAGRCAFCSPAAAGPVGDSPWRAESVDVPAAVEWQPEPAYPALLRTAGLSGRVILQFVVDTLGRVERGSVEVVESPHEAFAASAMASIEASRFHPARVRGRVVRQLVRQGVTFTVRDR
ncbi:MAG: energy transducer TonB [Gemmatimonadales bacterium]